MASVDVVVVVSVVSPDSVAPVVAGSVAPVVATTVVGTSRVVKQELTSVALVSALGQQAEKMALGQ
jgi:hypothetical protein